MGFGLVTPGSLGPNCPHSTMQALIGVWGELPTAHRSQQRQVAPAALALKTQYIFRSFDGNCMSAIVKLMAQGLAFLGASFHIQWEPL